MSQPRRLSIFNVLFQFLMDLVKVDWEGSGLGRSEILFGINCEVQMVSFVREERRDTSGSTQGIIISRFHKWKKLQPIILLIVAVYSNLLF